MSDEGEASAGVLRPKPLLPVIGNPRAFTVAGGQSPRRETRPGIGLAGGVGTRSFYAAAHQGVNPHDSHFHMQARLGIPRQQQKTTVRLRPLARRGSDAVPATLVKPPVGGFLKHRRIVVPAAPHPPGRGGPPMASPRPPPPRGAEHAPLEEDRAWPPKLQPDVAASLTSESRPCTVWAPGPGLQRPGSVPWQGPPGSAAHQDAVLQYAAEELCAGVVERAFLGEEGEFLS